MGECIDNTHAQCVILGEILLATLDRLRQELLTDGALGQYQGTSLDTGRRQVIEYLITSYYKNKSLPQTTTPLGKKRPLVSTHSTPVPSGVIFRNTIGTVVHGNDSQPSRKRRKNSTVVRKSVGDVISQVSSVSPNSCVMQQTNNNAKRTKDLIVIEPMCDNKIEPTPANIEPTPVNIEPTPPNIEKSSANIELRPITSNGVSYQNVDIHQSGNQTEETDNDYTYDDEETTDFKTENSNDSDLPNVNDSSLVNSSVAIAAEQFLVAGSSQSYDGSMGTEDQMDQSHNTEETTAYCPDIAIKQEVTEDFETPSEPILPQPSSSRRTRHVPSAPNSGAYCLRSLSSGKKKNTPTSSNSAETPTSSSNLSPYMEKKMQLSPNGLKQFMDKNRHIMRSYRKNMSEKQRKAQAEKTKLRMRRYRSNNKEKKKKNAHTTIAMNSNQKKENLREMWRVAKQKQRQNMSLQAKKQQLEKRRERYKRKSKRKLIDADTQTCANQVEQPLKNCTPRKRKALLEEGLMPPANNVDEGI